MCATTKLRWHTHYGIHINFMARNKLIYQEEKEEKQLQERNEGFHELTEI